MPIEPSLNPPAHTGHLISRRRMIGAGLAPLLPLRGIGTEPIQAPGRRSALALPLQGVESGWHALAVSPDGTTAYVAFNTPDVVLVVDLRAGRLRSAIDLSPAGVMLLSNQAVLSPDGKFLFVANQGVNNIAVIDTSTERVVKVLPFCPMNGDAVKSAAGGKVYIGLMDGRLVTVSCADLSYKTTTLPVALNSIAFSPQRANLLYAVSVGGYNLGPDNGKSIFHAFDLDTGREERQVVLPPASCKFSGGVSRLAVAASGEAAYLGWQESDVGAITAVDLKTFRVGDPRRIQDGAYDFAVHPETGRVYITGDWMGPMQGREPDAMYINEWDPATQEVARRLRISPSKSIGAISFDPLDPRYVYSTEVFQGMIRKVNIVTGAEVMRVRFFPGTRQPRTIVTAGSMAYITCLKSPLVHKLDLISGKLAGTLDLPGLSGSGDCGYFEGKLYVGGYSFFSVISAEDGAPIFTRKMPDGLGLTKPTFFRDKIAVGACLNGGDPDRMLILDARTLDVLNTFPLELPLVNRLGCAAASPDGSKLYVQMGIFARRTILLVLDSATLRVLKRVEPPTTAFMGGDGEAAAFDQEKRVAYLGGFNSIYRMHMDTNEFLGMLNIYDVYKEMGRGQGWPTSALTAVHLSPENDRLLIVSWDGHAVFQYDLKKEKWIPRVVWVGLGPAGAAMSPDRKSLYTINYRSDDISRFDTVASQLVEMTPLSGPASKLSNDSIRNGASFQHMGIVPGCVMVIRDRGGLPGEIGPPFLTPFELDASGRVATTLAGTQVLVDGVAAPILSAYAARVTFVAPYSIAGKQKVKVQLVNNGEATSPVEFDVHQAGAAIFTRDSSGVGQAEMANEDGAPNGPARPAAKGSVVTFRATGGGQTDPPGVDGEITKDVLARPLLPVYVWIQGQEAEVLYAGAAPGEVSGVMQVNVRVPLGVVADNTAPVTMQVGDWGFSQPGVTMAVG